MIKELPAPDRSLCGEGLGVFRCRTQGGIPQQKGSHHQPERIDGPRRAGRQLKLQPIISTTALMKVLHQKINGYSWCPDQWSSCLMLSFQAQPKNSGSINKHHRLDEGTSSKSPCLLKDHGTSPNHKHPSQKGLRIQIYPFQVSRLFRRLKAIAGKAYA